MKLLLAVILLATLSTSWSACNSKKCRYYDRQKEYRKSERLHRVPRDTYHPTILRQDYNSNSRKLPGDEPANPVLPSRARNYGPIQNSQIYRPIPDEIPYHPSRFNVGSDSYRDASSYRNREQQKQLEERQTNNRQYWPLYKYPDISAEQYARAISNKRREQHETSRFIKADKEEDEETDSTKVKTAPRIPELTYPIGFDFGNPASENRQIYKKDYHTSRHVLENIQDKNLRESNYQVSDLQNDGQPQYRPNDPALFAKVHTFHEVDDQQFFNKTDKSKVENEELLSSDNGKNVHESKFYKAEEKRENVLKNHTEKSISEKDYYETNPRLQQDSYIPQSGINSYDRSYGTLSDRIGIPEGNGEDRTGEMNVPGMYALNPSINMDRHSVVFDKSEQKDVQFHNHSDVVDSLKSDKINIEKNTGDITDEKVVHFSRNEQDSSFSSHSDVRIHDEKQDDSFNMRTGSENKQPTINIQGQAKTYMNQAETKVSQYNVVPRPSNSSQDLPGNIPSYNIPADIQKMNKVAVNQTVISYGTIPHPEVYRPLPRAPTSPHIPSSGGPSPTDFQYHVVSPLHQKGNSRPSSTLSEAGYLRGYTPDKTPSVYNRNFDRLHIVPQPYLKKEAPRTGLSPQLSNIRRYPATEVGVENIMQHGLHKSTENKFDTHSIIDDHEKRLEQKGPEFPSLYDQGGLIDMYKTHDRHQENTMKFYNRSDVDDYDKFRVNLDESYRPMLNKEPVIDIFKQRERHEHDKIQSYDHRTSDEHDEFRQHGQRARLPYLPGQGQGGAPDIFRSHDSHSEKTIQTYNKTDVDDFDKLRVNVDKTYRPPFVREPSIDIFKQRERHEHDNVQSYDHRKSDEHDEFRQHGNRPRPPYFPGVGQSGAPDIFRSHDSHSEKTLQTYNKTNVDDLDKLRVNVDKSYRPPFVREPAIDIFKQRERHEHDNVQSYDHRKSDEHDEFRQHGNRPRPPYFPGVGQVGAPEIFRSHDSHSEKTIQTYNKTDVDDFDKSRDKSYRPILNKEPVIDIFKQRERHEHDKVQSYDHRNSDQHDEFHQHGHRPRPPYFPGVGQGGTSDIIRSHDSHSEKTLQTYNKTDVDDFDKLRVNVDKFYQPTLIKEPASDVAKESVRHEHDKFQRYDQRKSVDHEESRQYDNRGFPQLGTFPGFSDVPIDIKPLETPNYMDRDRLSSEEESRRYFSNFRSEQDKFFNNFNTRSYDNSQSGRAIPSSRVPLVQKDVFGGTWVYYQPGKYEEMTNILRKAMDSNCTNNKVGENNSVVQSGMNKDMTIGNQYTQNRDHKYRPNDLFRQNIPEGISSFNREEYYRNPLRFVAEGNSTSGTKSVNFNLYGQSQGI